METTSINNVEKLEFRQIVLGHIKRILEISSHELRDTTTHTTHANYTETIEHEDTRYSYMQAIENLGYVLLPYFDKHMQKVYDECVYIINAFGFQIKKVLEKEYSDLCNDANKELADKHFALDMKMRFAKILFCELNLLLKRNDYLKSAVYGEDKDELGREDDEGG